MISFDLKSEPKITSPLSLSAKKDEPKLSFSELLKGVTVSTETKTVQNGALVLSLNDKVVQTNVSAKTVTNIPSKETLSSLLQGSEVTKVDEKKAPILNKETVELNPKLMQNLSVAEIKTLISDAKEYLKEKIEQSDGYKKAQIKELPNTLKGLVEVAKKFNIDISKITVEEVQIKNTKFELPKQEIAQVQIPKEVPTLKEAIKTQAPQAKNVFETNVSRVQEAVKTEVPTLKEAIKTQIPEPKNVLETNVSRVQEAVKTEVPTLKEAIKTQTPQAKNVLETNIPRVHEAVKTEVPTLKEAIKTQTPQAKNVLETNIPRVHEAVKTEVPTLKEAIKVQMPEPKKVLETDTLRVHEAVKTEVPKNEIPLPSIKERTKAEEISSQKMEIKAKEPKHLETIKLDEKNSEVVRVEDKKTELPKNLSQFKETPLFKAQERTEHTTEQFVQTKQFKIEEKTPKQKADETLKLLLRGEKPSVTAPAMTPDFSVATAKVLASSAVTEGDKSLEKLLRGEQKESTTAQKLDGLSTTHKADSFEVKLNEAKQMVKYISADVKTAIEDYKSPFTRIKVQLNPQKLGEVELTIIQRGKNLHINIGSNNTAINTLSMNVNELKTQLSNNGIQNATLNFNNNSQSDGSSFGQQQQQQKHNEQQARQEYDYYDKEEKNEEVLSSLEIVVPHYI